MSTRTKLILLLVLVIVLFVAVLFFDVIFKKKNGRPSDLDSLSQMTDNALFHVTEALAPKLKLSTLRCGTQRVDRPFTLKEPLAAECRIRIRRDGGTAVRTAKLHASGNNLDVYVFAQFVKKDFPERKRDPDKCIQDDSKLNPFRLEVVNMPKEESKPVWECWLMQERGEGVAIVALENGGKLNLKCVGCNSGSRSLRLEMR